MNEVTPDNAARATPVAYARCYDSGKPIYDDVVLPNSQEAEMWAYKLEPLYSAATVAALEAEVETCRRLLAEKVTAETMLRELHITPAGLAAQVEGGMAGILMRSIVDQFREIGGPNFFEMKFIADAQQYVLTVQRSAGLTPADKMKAAEQRADAAERRVAELEATLSRKDEIIRAFAASSTAQNVQRNQGGHNGDQGDEPWTYGRFGSGE